MIPKMILIVVTILIAFPISGLASEDFSIDGYYKNFSIVFDSSKLEMAKSNEAESIISSVDNKARINLFYHPSDWFSFSASYNITAKIQNPSLFESQPMVVGIDTPKYRLTELDSRLYPSEKNKVESFGVFQNLDRAFVKLTADVADVYIGRQAIAWGSARNFNPTDIIAPFTFDELDTEDRIGVDAVRVRIPIGFMGEFDTGYACGENFQFEQSAFFLRSKFYVLKTDISSLLIGFQENLLAGFDIARAFGGAGFWFEGAYVFVNAFNDYEASKEYNYFRGTTGFDYSLSKKTYGFIEYHFNHSGATESEDYLENISKPAYTEGAVYLMGRHYLAPGLTYQITPLITFNGQVILNLADKSIFLLPQIEYNIAQDIYLSSGVFKGIGKKPEKTKNHDSSAIKFNSEFGGYPDVYFVSFKIYF